MRRRIRCPGCRTTLNVTAAAEERGRMRCPDCDTVIDVRDARDDDDDRPRRREKKSRGSLLLWALLGCAGLIGLVCCGGVIAIVRLGSSGASESPVPLMEARAGFQTKLISRQRTGDDPAPPPPNDKFTLVRYKSPAGQLAAYVTPDRGDGQKRPAIIWAHGGFGGIDEDTWDDEEGPPMIFARAGFVVMCPSWRGENDNPGVYEMFYGEVDDAVAAVDYVAKLPYVDSSRVYMAGHSTGGTITLLTVEATNKLRAAFSFGGAPDIGTVLGPFGLGGYPDVDTPFLPRDKKEARLRSAVDYIHHVRTPTFYFEGEREAYIPDARKMEVQAKKGGAPVQVFEVKRGDHFNIPEPICGLIASKIRTDTGKTCNITMNDSEVQQAFDRAKK